VCYVTHRARLRTEGTEREYILSSNSQQSGTCNNTTAVLRYKHQHDVILRIYSVLACSVDPGLPHHACAILKRW
jgi:hypothetical protein